MQQPGGNPGGSPNPNPEPSGEKFEPMDLEPKKPSSLVTIATVIIVVAVIIIISNAIREDSANHEGEVMHEGDLTVEVGESHVEGTPEGEETQGSTALAADFLAPEQFSDLDRAERIINSTQGKNPGTTLAEFVQTGVVADPEEEGIYYFATATPNPISNFVGIYKYNIANAYWNRLTKNTFTPNEEGLTAMWRVLGKDGDNLIIMEDILNREIGPCESFWLQGTKEGFGLFTLRIDEPLHGLARYQLPETVRSAEQEKVDSCLQAK